MDMRWCCDCTDPATVQVGELAPQTLRITAWPAERHVCQDTGGVLGVVHHDGVEVVEQRLACGVVQTAHHAEIDEADAAGHPAASDFRDAGRHGRSRPGRSSARCC